MNNHKDDPYDILNECLAEICELTEEKQLSIISYFDYYMIQMLKYSTKSKTSKYQRKYNKDKEIIIKQPYTEEIIYEEDITFEYELNDILELIKDFDDIYSKEVMIKFINSGKKTFNQFAVDMEKLNIPRSSLYSAYKKSCSYIQNKIK